MDDLILYDHNRNKKQIIRNCIEFDCAVGRNAYSDNDFVFKTPFDKDELYEVGEWVSYGYTEYGGIIRSRTISTKDNLVTYTGTTFRGVLAYLPVFSKTSYDANDGKHRGTPHGVMNWMFRWQYVEDEESEIGYGQMPYEVIKAISDITAEADVGTYSTNGLMFTNFLYINDNIVKTFSTALKRPIKSKFSLRDGVINIEYVYANTYNYDSSRVTLLYSYNANTPTICLMSSQKFRQTHGGASGDEDMGYSAQWTYLYLDENGNPTANEKKWVAYNDVSKCIALIGEAQDEESGADSSITLECQDRLLEAQERPSTEIEIDTEEAEVDDVIIASIAELKMKVTKKVVESRLKISNGIPKITYTLEG